jgi:putative selenate reductase
VQETAKPNGIKVGIIGAGPPAAPCAYFLALRVLTKKLREKQMPGGWAWMHPTFRLNDDSIRKDIDAITSLGVTIHYGAAIDRAEFEKMRKEFDYLYIAVGAQEGVELGIPGEDAEGVMDQLVFLSAVRRGQRPELGKKVAVIGGGNSAMDAARTAKRLVGPDGEVSVLYRRTRREMPAAPEEVQAMLDEGIQLVELTAPECLLMEDGRVKSNLCFRMKLGEKDASGRPRPIKIDGSEFELQVDSVHSAIGPRATLAFFPEKKLQSHPATHETQLENVFAGGDAVRGPSTLIKAIADGKKVAETICLRSVEGRQVPGRMPTKTPDLAALRRRKSRRQAGAHMPEIGFGERFGFDLVVRTMDEATAQAEASRCLQCDEICSVCVAVCPNRANVEFQMEPVSFKIQEVSKGANGVEIVDVETERIEQKYQILNLGDYATSAATAPLLPHQRRSIPGQGQISRHCSKLRLRTPGLLFYGSQPFGI